MSKRRIGLWSLAAALVVLAAVGAVFLRPFSLPDPAGEPLSLVYIKEEIRIENFAALPEGTSQTYYLTPGSEAYETVASVLTGLEYRRCFRTLGRDRGDFAGAEEEVFVIWQDQVVYGSAAEPDHLLINGTIYRSGSAGELLSACQAAIAALSEAKEETQ